MACNETKEMCKRTGMNVFILVPKELKAQKYQLLKSPSSNPDVRILSKRTG